ncbi:MAG: alanine dehydrogenase [Actinomycetaceae bacterium]|nr:alanine dehydrogenase [Actinomycetaceae bacterium]
MRIGVPAEVKNNEFRVAATADIVAELTGRGHQVTVQAGAGTASGISDDAYAHAGATIAATAEQAWDNELVLKVKEPIASEYPLLRDDLTLFTYLHLAADEPLTDALLAAGTRGIAYETVREADGSLPLLLPMSEIAGRLSVMVGAHYCMRPVGGSGQLLSGVPGTARGKVVVLGAGVAGQSAIAMAVGLRAEVTVIDIDLKKLRAVEAQFPGQVTTLASSAPAIASAVADADLVIGAVLSPGARAPKLVTDEMIRSTRPGTIFVDIAIDQGGCFEGSKPTTHAEPTYQVHDALFYCVANMPGAVPRTSTAALTSATMRYVLDLADKGVETALRESPALTEGVNTWDGLLVNEPVARAFGREASALEL